MAEVFQRHIRQTSTAGNTVVVRDANGEVPGVDDLQNIVAGTNLNTLTSGGKWVQASNANATVALNYPADNVAGALEVLPYESSTAIIQRYTMRDTGIIWVRYYSGSAWTSWATYIAPAPPAYVPPTGSVQLWSGTVATLPSGWLVCDGSAVSRTTFADLFIITGTRFGSGNGTTTFNLPNLTGRFARGAPGDPGPTGGADSHVHGLSTAVADFRSAGIGPTFHVRTRTSTSPRDMNRTLTAAANQADGGTVDSSAGIALTGNTDSASNVPSYLDMLYIIKT